MLKFNPEVSYSDELYKLYDNPGLFRLISKDDDQDKLMYYLYAVSTNVKRNFNPNHLMNYEMIKWGIETGATQYDFGGFFEKSDGLYKRRVNGVHRRN
ncbi:GNAT family N-acetyltransferase [Virgibacillus sp. DJP39]|uniref:GNAT family N-acetyltransferase n=1 Tax=Virgibacillus sp. DJP39 TaxID=3409790 RepID=UPI003BB539E8